MVVPKMARIMVSDSPDRAKRGTTEPIATSRQSICTVKTTPT